MILVVPVHGNSQVSLTFSVFFNFVMLLENPDEMHEVFFSNVFNAKIIHNERETGGAPFVLPIAWCEFALCVAYFLELFRKDFLHYDTYLRESIHSLSYLTVHVSVVINLVC